MRTRGKVGGKFKLSNFSALLLHKKPINNQLLKKFSIKLKIS